MKLLSCLLLLAWALPGVANDVSYSDLKGTLLAESPESGDESFDEDMEMSLDLGGDEASDEFAQELEGGSPPPSDLESGQAEEPAPVAKESEPVPPPAYSGPPEEPKEEVAKPMTSPKPAPPVAAKSSPKAKPMKSGFRRLRSNCKMRSIASVKGKPLKTLKKGKKLWVEPHNSSWTKIFRKNGEAYISNSCL